MEFTVTDEKAHCIVSTQTLRFDEALQLLQCFGVDPFGGIADHLEFDMQARRMDRFQIVAVDGVWGRAIVTVMWLRSTLPTRLRLPCETSMMPWAASIWIAPRTVSRLT